MGRLAVETFRLGDDQSSFFGDAGDGIIQYNGVDLIINPQVVGSGSLVIGKGEGGTTIATGTTLRAPDLVTGGAGNIAGADLTISPGLGTGTGDVGQIIFEAVRVAAAGDNIHTKNVAFTVDDNGTVPVLDLQSATQLINVGASGNKWTSGGIIMDTPISGTDLLMRFNNTSPDANSFATLDMRVGGTSAGDPQIMMRVNGGEVLTFGLDNDVADNFTISDGTALGTADRLRLVVATGVLSVDGDGGGADDPVALFDDYDDAALARSFAYSHPAVPETGLITRKQWEANRALMVEIGVAEWADQDAGDPHIMFRIQPMLRMLAGGVYQNRRVLGELIDGQNSRILELERRLALAGG